MGANYMNDNIEIGRKIHNARKALKISMKELGQKVGLHESTISRYEKGEIQSLDIEKLKEFAQALNVSASYLIGWQEEKLNDDDKKKNDTATGIVIRLGNDEEFRELVKMLYKMDSKQIASIKAMLTSFIK